MHIFYKAPNLVIYFFLFLIYFSDCPCVYAQTWQWAESGIGSSETSGCYMVTDSSNNTYITGSFDSPSITFGSYTLINNSGFDIFIAKYDVSGNVLWAMNSLGSGYALSSGIDVDGNGNIYISGHFWSTNFTLDSITLPNYGDYDIFITKLDNIGNVLWSKSVGGSDYDSAGGITVDYNGNFYVTGNFKSDSLLFDSIILTNTSNFHSVFVVKYDSSANAVWAKSSIGSGYDVSHGIALDNNQNVVITGTFDGSSITFDSLTLSNSGTGSLFIVKYNDYGNFIWAKSAVGSGAGVGIVTDLNNNILIIGEFTNPSITFDSITLTSNGGSDAFIIKLDNSGNVIWAKKAGGNDDDFGLSIAVDSYENTYVTGSFISPILLLDTLVLNNSTIGFPDLFVATYDQFGNISLVVGALSSSLTSCSAIVLDGNKDIYISGVFAGSTLTFGSTILTNTTPFSSDIFVAKLSNILNGINENTPMLEEISIVPNPFSSQSILYTNISLNNATITFSNILGQEVFHLSNLQGKSANLNRNNLSCGIYLVRIIQDNQIIATKKVIITD